MKNIEKRIKHITSKHPFMMKDTLNSLIKGLEEGDFLKFHKKHLLEVKNIYSLFEQIGITNQSEIEKIWIKNLIQQNKRSEVYSLTPIKERKDNKDSINWGSGSGNKNKIRYPKKCRKTAWKRFYKLFPHLKLKE